VSADRYYNCIQEVLGRIRSTQMEKIGRAAEALAVAITRDKRVYLFGSGHSVIPVLDVFPRYGSFTGFFPLYDPRLMWFNVVGPGGARELLWLERQEGYAPVFLQSYPLQAGDCMIVFSHGGRNAAPIEVAMEAKKKGLTVITVSSLSNAAAGAATHSTGRQLPDVADIAIDNCVPPEDALVDVGWMERVAADPLSRRCRWRWLWLRRQARAWRRRASGRRPLFLRMWTASRRNTIPGCSTSLRSSFSAASRRCLHDEF